MSISVPDGGDSRNRGLSGSVPVVVKGRKEAGKTDWGQGGTFGRWDRRGNQGRSCRVFAFFFELWKAVGEFEWRDQLCLPPPQLFLWKILQSQSTGVNNPQGLVTKLWQLSTVAFVSQALLFWSQFQLSFYLMARCSTNL